MSNQQSLLTFFVQHTPILCTKNEIAVRKEFNEYARIKISGRLDQRAKKDISGMYGVKE